MLCGRADSYDSPHRMSECLMGAHLLRCQKSGQEELVQGRYLAPTRDSIRIIPALTNKIVHQFFQVFHWIDTVGRAISSQLSEVHKMNSEVLPCSTGSRTVANDHFARDFIAKRSDELRETPLQTFLHSKLVNLLCGANGNCGSKCANN